MKKFYIILLAVVLALSGCRSKAPAETQEPTVEETTVPIETLADGAVSVFPMVDNEHTNLFFMGDKPVVLSREKNLTVLNPQNGQMITTAEMEGKIQPDTPGFAVSAMSIAYFLPDTEEVVVVNPNLQTGNRIRLPENAEGTPAISLKSQEIFYCSGCELRALHMETGISRLVRSFDCKEQQLIGSYFEGDLLHVLVVDQQDTVKNQYVETKTGRVVSEDEGVYDLTTGEDQYFAFRLDGMVAQQIFGQRGGTPNGFAYGDFVYPLPIMHGAVRAEKMDDGLQLNYYDLDQMLRTAEVHLPQVNDPVQIASGGGYVWILAQDAASGQQHLYKWDVKKSAVTDDTSCTVAIYSAEHPDEEGLEAVRKRAKEMASQNGVVFYLAKNGVFQHEELNLREEYQVPAISTMLDELEPVLAQFPQGFLNRTLEGGSINICLVRAIGEGQTAATVYSGGDFWIYLTPESNMEQEFLLSLGQVVDSHVLGNSRKYDSWDSLNPEGFQYGAESQDSSLLAGDTQAFADADSMAAPSADRGRLLYYAVTPAGEELFRAPVMQQKLLTMCRGIREAYEYEKKTDVYPWEQYLTEPIAYVK